MAIGLTNANEVKAVQEWLNKNGFKDAEGNELAVDGRLGPRTKNAIKLAQQYLQSEGLYDGKIDGIVGQQTIDAMNEFSTTGGLEAVYNVSDLGSFYTGNQKDYETSIIGGPLVSGSELPIRERVNKAKEAISAAAAGQSAARQAASEKISAQGTAKNNTAATVKVAYGTLHVDKNGKVTSKEGPEFGLGPEERSSLERDRQDLENGLANGTVVINGNRTVTVKNHSNKLSPKQDADARKEAEEAISNNIGLKSFGNWVKGEREKSMELGREAERQGRAHKYVLKVTPKKQRRTRPLT